MSRTYRHRRTLPPTFIGRDGGAVVPRSPGALTVDARVDPAAWRREVRRILPPPYRRDELRCELRPARHVHHRGYRHVANELVRAGRFDELLPFRGTSGWLTW